MVYNDLLHSSVCETLDHAVKIKGSKLMISRYKKEYLLFSIISNQIWVKLLSEIYLFTTTNEHSLTESDYSKIISPKYDNDQWLETDINDMGPPCWLHINILQLRN